MNITPTERLGRIAVGLAAIIAGIVLLTSAGPAVAVVLELLLVAAGLDLAVTGALGHCPLYASRARSSRRRIAGASRDRRHSQRLARGEISPEEYQRLRDLISADTHHAAAGAGSQQ